MFCLQKKGGEAWETVSVFPAERAAAAAGCLRLLAQYARTPDWRLVWKDQPSPEELALVRDEGPVA